MLAGGESLPAGRRLWRKNLMSPPEAGRLNHYPVRRSLGEGGTMGAGVPKIYSVFIGDNFNKTFAYAGKR